MAFPRNLVDVRHAFSEYLLLTEHFGVIGKLMALRRTRVNIAIKHGTTKKQDQWAAANHVEKKHTKAENNLHPGIDCQNRRRLAGWLFAKDGVHISQGIRHRYAPLF